MKVLKKTSLIFSLLPFVFLCSCSKDNKVDRVEERVTVQDVEMILKENGLENFEVTIPDSEHEFNSQHDFDSKAEFEKFAQELAISNEKVRKYVADRNKINKIRNQRLLEELSKSKTAKDSIRVFFDFPDLVTIVSWDKVIEEGLISEAIEAGIFVPEQYRQSVK